MILPTSVQTSTASIQIVADHLRNVAMAEGSRVEIENAAIALESVAADLLINENAGF